MEQLRFAVRQIMPNVPAALAKAFAPVR